MKKERKFKGCLKRAIMPICIIGFCVLVAIISFIPMVGNLGKLTSYGSLIKELSVGVKDSDMSANPVGVNELRAMQGKVNEFVECKELDEHGNPKDVFNIKGDFEYEYVKRDNINILADEIAFNKGELGAFVNSIIGAGWIEGFYDQRNAKNLISVLEITDITVRNDITKLSLITKVDINFLLGDDSSSETQDIIKQIDTWLYLTYDVEFSKDEVLGANLHINKISEQSNKAFLQLILDTNDDAILNEKLGTIWQAISTQMEKLNTEWGFSYYFVDDGFVIENA